MLNQRTWYGIGMLMWLIVVLALTMLPGRGAFMQHIAGYFGRSDLHGALGHMGLMASLLWVLFSGLSRMMKAKYALLLSVILVFTIGTATELYQADVYGRASTLADLLGNWVGTFASGYILSLVIR